METYPGRNSKVLLPPSPAHYLPSGAEHIALQYLLGTVRIPEVSYKDHDKVLHEFLWQMQFSSAEDQMNLSMKKLVFWCGDQLTVDRLRGLFKFHAEDDNSFKCLDWMVLSFGWFHLQMAFANSLYTQYYGTSMGHGIKHAIDVLEWKGLDAKSTKGPFHHNLEEALYHIAEAHICLDWLAVGGVKSLAKLRERSLEDLFELAQQLMANYASSLAMKKMKNRPEKKEMRLNNKPLCGTVMSCSISSSTMPSSKETSA